MLLGLLLQQKRFKTFRKTPTKAFLKKLELGVKFKPKTETKFFRIIGGMKVYKSVSPGSTHRRHPTKDHLHKGSAIKRLSFGKRSTGGRNSSGRITIRHRGGGHKKRVRMVDFMRKIPGPHEIVRFEYDPNRSGELCLLRNLATNEFSYILRGAEMKVGQVVYSYRDGLSSLATMENFSKSDIVKPGNCLLLSDIPVGTRIHNIGLRKNGPAKICRSAGSYAQLLSTSPTGYAQIRLASKEVRMIPVTACATIGTVGNEAHKLRVWGKAGARRRKGWRPAVRGIAMSPYDHPHGGGSKSKGGKAPRSIWGWKTKGPRTVKRKRWFIITPRWKAAT